MYLNSGDYQTIWQLAHGWAGKDSNDTDPNNLPSEIKDGIHRVMVAIRNKLISVRTPSHVILDGDSAWDFPLNFSHLRKFNACLTNNRFDKNYLNSLYIWRPEVIRWCVNDQLPIPSVWQPKPDTESIEENDSKKQDWIDKLTLRKKGIVTALQIAARLWEEDRSLSYEQVWNHSDMKKYDKPRIFPSLESFKEWAKDIAPQPAKSPGRRKNSV